jgi:hypothetical protein
MEVEVLTEQQIWQAPEVGEARSEVVEWNTVMTER